jgi:hypothetical protein
LSTCSKVSGAFRGLRPNPTGSALPFSCFRRPHDDTASFTSCCGPPHCSTPLRTRHLGRPRGFRYRGPWRLPGPDLHRLVVVSFPLGCVMAAPLQARRPELLDARDFRGIPGSFGQPSRRYPTAPFRLRRRINLSPGGPLLNRSCHSSLTTRFSAPSNGMWAPVTYLAPSEASHSTASITLV